MNKKQKAKKFPLPVVTDQNIGDWLQWIGKAATEQIIVNRVKCFEHVKLETYRTMDTLTDIDARINEIHDEISNLMEYLDFGKGIKHKNNREIVKQMRSLVKEKRDLRLKRAKIIIQYQQNVKNKRKA